MFKTVVDLTHSVSGNAPNWEGTPNSVKVDVLADYDLNGYFARRVSIDEHASTHIDAPAHMAKGAWTVEQIPVERLVGPLVVLDVTGSVAGNPDYRIQAEDVTEWEKRYKAVPRGSIVIAHTGWGTRWPSSETYRNADGKGILHFPGYSLEAAMLLVECRHAVGLGIDTLSVDYGPSETYEVHKFCAQRGVYHLESVANLEGVPRCGATVVVSPMKLEGGSGAPVRILALVE